MWAIWWLLGLDAEADSINLEHKADAADAFLDSSDLLSALAGARVEQDGTPDYLTPAHFEKSIVKALMKPINENHPWKNIPPHVERARNDWMDAEQAVDLVTGATLEDAFQGMQL
ncbi:hypothetical protein BU23DRAFT_568817 [Bimuria novae-zelandiae CBS 107.79]|uniref:Uncharacterized protein n=1 Tax=Bimuria novae-zelandiae CBS 107.79 TaxID=1447943 RepID=A0A6A5V6A1_9PLEO|nr:hypothetical protein BU23DRAFT_568817 [Bimuria novae-zelandiae CBS 107.79]